jgi:hypothetical protein
LLVCGFQIARRVKVGVGLIGVSMVGQSAMALEPSAELGTSRQPGVMEQ